MNYGTLRSILNKFDTFMNDDAPVYVELNGIEFDLDSIVNGQGSHPLLISGRTESGRMGRRIRLYNERHSKRGDLLLSHVQSILDNNREKGQINQKNYEIQSKTVLLSQTEKEQRT